MENSCLFKNELTTESDILHGTRSTCKIPQEYNHMFNHYCKKQAK